MGRSLAFMILGLLTSCVEAPGTLEPLPEAPGPQVGCAPALRPTSLSFGVLIAPTRRSVELENEGDAPCTLVEARIAPGRGDIGVETVLPVGLPPWRVLPLTFSFIPSRSGLDARIELVFAEGPVLELTASGVSAPDTLTLVPGVLDFGAVGAGCLAAPRTLLALSPRPGELRVTPPVSPDVEVRLGSFVPSGDAAELSVELRPLVEGERVLELEVATSEAMEKARLRVAGVSRARDERFSVGPAPKLDVLFVADDASADPAERAAWEANVAAFVRELPSEADLHLGAVAARGGVELGWLAHAPRNPTFMRTASDGFVVNAAGASRTALGLSKGLDAAVRALGPELAERNAGFRRPDAALFIAFVSDRPDRSETTPAEARAALTAGSAPVVLAASVADARCPGPTGQASTDGRYRAASDIQTSVCQADMGAELARAAVELAVGERGRFQLAAAPEAGSVEVEVDGASLDARAFTVSTEARLVTLASLPAPGAQVRIRYLAACP